MYARDMMYLDDDGCESNLFLTRTLGLNAFLKDFNADMVLNVCSNG